jgi:type IX secretion system PorP/SprF family membrane protein
MMCKRITGAVLLLLLLHTGAAAQDLHFSQFMNSPLTTNPANTGFIPEADYRIGGNFRNQWTSIPVLLNDVAGRGNLRSNKVYASVAYHQMIGDGSLLSAGFNAGYANKRIDITKLTFDNQWNGKFFDAGAPNGESVLNNPNTSYFDLQVGMNYAYFPTENTYINAGVSVHHINKPKETFFSNGTNEVPRRYIGFLNGSFKVNDDWIVNPNAYFSSQASANELVFGGNLAHNVLGDGSVVVFGGAYYRWNDAAVAMIGLEWKDIRFTFTYDATTSNLARFNSANGAYEFSLIKNGYYNEYFGDKSQRRQSMCPRF